MKLTVIIILLTTVLCSYDPVADTRVSLGSDIQHTLTSLTAVPITAA